MCTQLATVYLTDEDTECVPLRPCPECSSTKRELLTRLHFLRKEQQVFSCLSCGMVYACSPLVDYANDSIYSCPTTYGSRAGEREHYDQLIQRIRSYVKPSARILDVGCATGGLLQALSDIGFQDVEGIDLPQSSITLCKSKGLRAEQCSVHELGMATYDLVILSHVLEHVPDVQDFLQAIAPSLTSSGMIYIEVPDASRYADHFVGPSHGFNLEHINHFDKAHLRDACKRARLQQITSGDADFAWIDGIMYPAIWGLYAPVTPDIRLRSAIVRHINKLDRQTAGLSAKIEARLSGQQEIAVWGLGHMMMCLFSLPSMQGKRVTAATDSNPMFHGKQVLGATVNGPEDFKPAAGIPILVCSPRWKSDIVARIHELGLTNDIITFD